MPNQTPGVGRVVHYVAYGTPGGEFPAGAHRAAIITEVDAKDTPIMSVGLAVLNPTGLHFQRGVLRDDAGEQPGSWHWPEYVPPTDAPPAPTNPNLTDLENDE